MSGTLGMTVVSQTCWSLLVDFSAHWYARIMEFVATPEDYAAFLRVSVHNVKPSRPVVPANAPAPLLTADLGPESNPILKQFRRNNKTDLQIKGHKRAAHARLLLRCSRFSVLFDSRSD